MRRRLGESSAVNPAEEGGRKQKASDGVFAIQATLVEQEQRTTHRMDALERVVNAQGKKVEGALSALSRVERALAVLTAGMGAGAYSDISAEPQSPPPRTPSEKASKAAKRQHRRSQRAGVGAQSEGSNLAGEASGERV